MPCLYDFFSGQSFFLWEKQFTTAPLYFTHDIIDNHNIFLYKLLSTEHISL